MSIIDHTLIKYDMPFCTYLDLLPLNLYVLSQKLVNLSWKIIFPWLWEPDGVCVCVCDVFIFH